MRLKEKYNKWRDSRNIFKLMPRKTLLLISIIIVTILIFGTIIWFFMAIYTKDKPDFIPKETRGSIREGIKNNIAKPLAAVIPAVGNPFYNAAFTYKNNDSFTNSNNFDNTNPSDFKDWKTYKNEELGFELKYPEDYQLINVIGSDFAIAKINDIEELEKLKEEFKDTNNPYWGGKIIGIQTYLLEEEKSILDLIYKNFSDEDIEINNINKDKIFVTDKGLNRFGGGTGYYYYYLKADKIFEIYLDYYGDQKIESTQVNLLKDIFNTFK